MWGVLQEYKVMGPLLRAISTTEVPPGGLKALLGKGTSGIPY